MRQQILVTSMVLALLIIGLITGCSSTEEAASPLPEPPDWVQGELSMSNMVCAIGASEPTYYIDDARASAAENCRKELARTIRTEITSVMLDVATEKNNTFEEASVSQTVASISKMVVENAEVLDYWLDSHGQITRKKNITYALCCMPDK